MKFPKWIRIFCLQRVIRRIRVYDPLMAKDRKIIKGDRVVTFIVDASTRPHIAAAICAYVQKPAGDEIEYQVLDPNENVVDTKRESINVTLERKLEFVVFGGPGRGWSTYDSIDSYIYDHILRIESIVKVWRIIQQVLFDFKPMRRPTKFSVTKFIVRNDLRKFKSTGLAEKMFGRRSFCAVMNRAQRRARKRRDQLDIILNDLVYAEDLVRPSRDDEYVIKNIISSYDSQHYRNILINWTKALVVVGIFTIGAMLIQAGAIKVPVLVEFKVSHPITITI